MYIVRKLDLDYLVESSLHRRNEKMIRHKRNNGNAKGFGAKFHLTDYVCWFGLKSVGNLCWSFVWGM